MLALQGDFYLHQRRLNELGVEALPVRKPEDLPDCQGLIMPGGESTTLAKLLKNRNLDDLIREFNRKWPIFGTCAGTILVSNHVTNHSVDTLNLIDIEVERNAYGRQINSFIDKFDLQIQDEKQSVEAVFIRAPKIVKTGKGIKILGRHHNDIVLVENDSVLAATFHPELTDSHQIHEYFINKVKERI